MRASCCVRDNRALSAEREPPTMEKLRHGENLKCGD